MVRILVVEDDTDINNMLRDALLKEDYEVVQAFSGTEALLHVKSETFSMIILDLMLPGLSGEQVLQQIKASYEVPIIILSSKDELDTKVNLLTLGADDYMTKPFEIKELLVRIVVQLRKSTGSSMKSILRFRDLELDRTNYRLKAAGSEVALIKHEFRIMELLMLHPEKVYSKNDIYEYAWDELYIGEDKTVNVHISNIRQKLRKITDTDYIETVWGIGFKLVS